MKIKYSLICCWADLWWFLDLCYCWKDKVFICSLLWWEAGEYSLLFILTVIWFIQVVELVSLPSCEVILAEEITAGVTIYVRCVKTQRCNCCQRCFYIVLNKYIKKYIYMYIKGMKQLRFHDKIPRRSGLSRHI